ncbi:phospholipase effector Tle1 domain-containing protein [Acinetobacter faecalis]|uniref:phospholipase effector Tle1 domain-containing protein n=1 Tax=Acinetobacter faecalis TaxID=2665161 RepID=UPI002A90BB7A|nr:DUF2235 domain-containing protein [Acinetobacter faecalis]MDY6450664.1 DUF2235 domain-containing protein [Acinetobacter faecalis]
MAEIKAKPGERVLATSRTTTPGGTCTDCHVDTFTVHIFFDGTGNNRFNTASHRENPKTSPKGSVSYENYYSNIALLFMAMQEFDDVKKIYIQGSGTEKGKKDDSLGLGLARSSTGRLERVEQAINELNMIVGDIDRGNVILNVYGFSRGAAWARHFCWLLKNFSYKRWSKCKINFVGIFDTVSSDTIEHYNDVKQLGLDIGRPQKINYIAHLTAQNDYREHFPLTPIHGAIKDGIGFECSFPGAHSDIGGGYSEIAKEENRFLGFVDDKLNINSNTSLKEEWIDTSWFMRKGYYRPMQISTKVHRFGAKGGRNTDAKLNKNARYSPVVADAYFANRTIKFHYQLIPCSIMYEIAKRKANFSLKKGTYFEKHLKEMKNISLLKKFHDTALTYVLANYKKNTGGHKVPFLAEAEMKVIFNEYIHSSLTYGDIANKGTLRSKTKNADGSLNYAQPIRPKVTQGFR